MKEKIKKYWWVIVIVFIIGGVFYCSNSWIHAHGIWISDAENNIIVIGTIVNIIGVLTIIILWLIDYIREKKFNRLILGRLNYELETNLPFINDDIYIIENNENKLTSPLGLIDDYIFDSLVKSHKIVFIPQNALDHLFCFYAQARNANKAMANKDLELALMLLKSAKEWLAKVYTILGKEQWYKDNELIGIRYNPPQKK